MSELKYKVGDRVKIKSLYWYNMNKNADGFVYCGDRVFDDYMSVFCESIVTIEEVFYNEYSIQEDMQCRTWTDEMFEGLVEDENIDCEKCGLTRNSIRCLFMDNCPHNKRKNIIEIPEDCVIKDENGNVINATKIVLEKKKKPYPKTYAECCRVLGVSEFEYNHTGTKMWYRHKLMATLDNLMLCRDAYWKIAGEEMGLGKPWEPDWCDYTTKYCIIYSPQYRGICIRQYDGIKHNLAFPTEEMRDAFKENFDPDIEICKEFL